MPAPPPGSFQPGPVVIPPVIPGMPEPSFVQPPVIPGQVGTYPPPGFVPQGTVIPEMGTGFPPRGATPSPDYSPVIPPRSYSGQGPRIPVIPSEQYPYEDEPRARPPRRHRPPTEYDDEAVVPPRPDGSRTPSSDLSYRDEPDRGERYSDRVDESGHPITIIPPPGHQYRMPEPVPPTLVRPPTSRRSSSRDRSQSPRSEEHEIHIHPPSPTYIPPPTGVGPSAPYPGQGPAAQEPMRPIIITQSPQPFGPGAGAPVVVQVPSAGMQGMPGYSGVPPGEISSQQPVTIVVGSDERRSRSRSRSPSRPSYRDTRRTRSRSRSRSRSPSPSHHRFRRTDSRPRSRSHTPTRTEVIQIPRSDRHSPPPIVVQQPFQPGFPQPPILQTVPSQPPFQPPFQPSVALPIPPPTTGVPIIVEGARSRRSRSQSRSPIIIHETRHSDGPSYRDRPPTSRVRTPYYEEGDPSGRPRLPHGVLRSRTGTGRSRSPTIVEGDPGRRHSPTIIVRSGTHRSRSRTPPIILSTDRHYRPGTHRSRSRSPPIILPSHRPSHHHTRSRSRSHSPIYVHDDSHRPRSPRITHVRTHGSSRRSRSPHTVVVESPRRSRSRSDGVRVIREGSTRRSSPRRHVTTRLPTTHITQSRSRSLSPRHDYEEDPGSHPGRHRSPQHVRIRHTSHSPPYSERDEGSPSHRRVIRRPSSRATRSREEG